MLMLLFHITIFLGLIALVSGVYLFSWSCKIERCFYKCVAWILGLIVIIISILGIICVGASGMKYKEALYKNLDMMQSMDMKQMMEAKGTNNNPTQKNKR